MVEFRFNVQRANVSNPIVTAVVLRHGTDDDVDALIDFWAREGENDHRPVDSPAAVRALLARDSEAIIIADLDGRVVGTVIAGWDGWRAHLYRLAVASDLRGRGIARLLIGEAEQRLASLGAVRFDAMVLAENVVGAAAWAALGYAAQDEWTRWVKPAPATPSSRDGA